MGGSLAAGLGAAPLGTQRPIHLAPSVSVYAQLATPEGRRAGSLSWLGFGDPLPVGSDGEEATALASLRSGGHVLRELPGTGEELAAIGGLFGSSGRALVRQLATEAAVRELADQAPLLHFACHGLVDPRRPMSSALVLSRAAPAAPEELRDPATDGLLQAWEVVEDLRLDADCVVLSACETGVGQVIAGEGVIGLTRAFFHAGTRSVVVSLWPIADQSTARLMAASYRGLKEGKRRDEALMRAKLELWSTAGLAHPAFWAAFQLHGRPAG